MAGTVQCDGAAAEAACTAPQAAAAECRRALSALTGWPMPPLAPSTATAWRSAAEELNMRGADGAAARSEERRAERASMVGRGWGMGGVRKIPRRPRSTPTALRAAQRAGTRAGSFMGAQAQRSPSVAAAVRSLTLSARFAGCQSRRRGPRPSALNVTPRPGDLCPSSQRTRACSRHPAAPLVPQIARQHGPHGLRGLRAGYQGPRLAPLPPPEGP